MSNGWPSEDFPGVPPNPDMPGTYWVTDALRIPRLATWRPTPGHPDVGYWLADDGSQGRGVDWTLIGPADRCGQLK